MGKGMGDEVTGSSPLARGTHDGTATLLSWTRFIPAGAGNTGQQPGNRRGRAVHPRWRGEHNSHTLPVAKLCGSSPLARGTRLQKRLPVLSHRFIPAGAGNTAAPSSAWISVTVHPRWRGEHIGLLAVEVAHFGSSPLARGTPSRPLTITGNERFIPAGAGNTATWSIRWRCRPVHPRWRGEHLFKALARCFAGGSSPLARGTLAVGLAQGADERFIPAGAGNTARSRGTARCGAVHPRWRGEHEVRAPGCGSRDGSSPLARGTRRCASPRSGSRRFIPAGAGNTCWWVKRRGACTVHPRWRGEHRQT